MLCEQPKHDGTLPIIGVNTFRAPEGSDPPAELELARASDTEKRWQIDRLEDFHARHRDEAQQALAKLRIAVTSNENVFAELMNSARAC